MTITAPARHDSTRFAGVRDACGGSAVPGATRYVSYVKGTRAACRMGGTRGMDAEKITTTYSYVRRRYFNHHNGDI